MTAGPVFTACIYKQTCGWGGYSVLQRIVECASFGRSWFEDVLEDYKEIREMERVLVPGLICRGNMIMFYIKCVLVEC